jgi:hypothetical protein
MQRSESIANLAKALAAAQGAIENAAKDADNPFFKSKYADLASIRDAMRVAFGNNGLSCPQFISTHLTDQHETRTDKDGSPFEAYLTMVSVETVLLHESGEFMSNVLDLAVWDADPQKVGSASTYGRRYALQSVAGVAAEIDDDGNKASGKPQDKAPYQQRPQNPGKPPQAGKPTTPQPTKPQPAPASSVGSQASQEKAREAVQGPPPVEQGDPGPACSLPASVEAEERLRTFANNFPPATSKPASQPAKAANGAGREPMTAATKKTMGDLARVLQYDKTKALAEAKAITGLEYADMREGDARQIIEVFQARAEALIQGDAE